VTVEVVSFLMQVFGFYFEKSGTGKA